jgi:hypothetical protein
MRKPMLLSCGVYRLLAAAAVLAGVTSLSTAGAPPPIPDFGGSV